MRYLFVLALALGLSGCAEYYAAKTGIATHGATVADEALDANVWGVCRAGSVGAVERRFWQTAEGFTGWWQFCHLNTPTPEPPPIAEAPSR